MSIQERWRPGRRRGRTLYIHQGDNEDGKLIGMVDTPELARRICDAVNERGLAEAAVERVRQALNDADWGGPERGEVVAEIRAALNEPKEKKTDG